MQTGSEETGSCGLTDCECLLREDNLNEEDGEEGMEEDGEEGGGGEEDKEGRWSPRGGKAGIPGTLFIILWIVCAFVRPFGSRSDQTILLLS